VPDLGRPATAIPSAFAQLGRRRAIAGLALLLLLLASLAGALADTTGGTASLRGGAASVALSVAGTLVGLLVVVFAAAIVYAMAAKRVGPADSEAPVRSPFWRGVTIALLMPIVIGIIVLLRRHRPHRQAASIAPSSLHLPTTGSAHSAIHFVPAASGATIGFVALVVALVILSSWLHARRRGRHWDLLEILRNPKEPTHIIGPRSPLAQSLATVCVPDPEEETDPRRAVVAAYVAMTHAAADAGAERRGAETPSEFLQRLLAALGASQDAARRLTFLFETARYSSKPFGETLRADAIGALRQVQDELASSASAGSGLAAAGLAGSTATRPRSAGAGGWIVAPP
jgi:hypothetical protein